ncbi:MAG: hypothetical protein ACXVID_09570, partial [Thermoanaerobaculia bacterium]
MKTRVTVLVVVLLAAAFGCEAASPAAGQAAAPKPAAPASAAPASTAPARPSPNDALLEWIEAFFAWGDGKVTLDTIPQIVFGTGTRLEVAKKTFTSDARMNDQVYLVIEDGAKTALVGDVLYDDERAKKPAPVRSDADLDGLRGKLKQYLVGAFSLVLDPASDRKGWKGVTIKADT